jgi:hypothetical protein
MVRTIQIFATEDASQQQQQKRSNMDPIEHKMIKASLPLVSSSTDSIKTSALMHGVGVLGFLASALVFTWFSLIPS